jgi:hypothetical protein
MMASASTTTTTTFTTSSIEIVFCLRDEKCVKDLVPHVERQLTNRLLKKNKVVRSGRFSRDEANGIIAEAMRAALFGQSHLYHLDRTVVFGGAKCTELDSSRFMLRCVRAPHDAYKGEAIIFESSGWTDIERQYVSTKNHNKLRVSVELFPMPLSHRQRLSTLLVTIPRLADTSLLRLLDAETLRLIVSHI